MTGWTRSVDNFHAFAEWMLHPDEDMFYFLQILMREKDGHRRLGGGNSKRCVKSYAIRDSRDLLDRRDEIVELCSAFNARAYIHPDRRRFSDVGAQMLRDTVDVVLSGNHGKMHRIWESACGKVKGDDRLFVVDLDGIDADTEDCASVRAFINSLKPHVEWDKTILVLPTVHGCHLITEPFDSMGFRQRHPDIDVHKNNPTLLYCRVR